jgi:SAM-dependent methyltransferase
MRTDYREITKRLASHVENVPNYTSEMRKALLDKVFFLDKVDANSFVDFGCADGSVLKLAHDIQPDHFYVGYDTAPEMIEVAKSTGSPEIVFTSDIDEVKNMLNRDKEGIVCLSLLSLIHEVYHYGPESVTKFWEFVFGSDFASHGRPNHGLFDYIAIRDMCVSKHVSRPSDPISVAKIRMNYDSSRLAQWESKWGSLDENWSLVHFLLTYRYVDSWERELHENYLPLSKEDLLALIPPQWEPVYIEHYTLPFLRNQVREDFDIDLQDRTHLKLILRRRQHNANYTL